MFDGKAFGEEMVGVVKAYVDRQCAPLIAENKALAERVAELEARELVVDLPDFDEIVARHVDEAVSKLPEPEPGKPGESVTLEDVAPMIDEAVARAVAEIQPVEATPAPEPIAPDMDAINETIERLVSDHIRSIPAPEDGKSVTVEDVQPLVAELIERAVAAIPVPKDGIGVAGMLINREGEAVATLSDGSTCNLGRVVGQDADREEIKAWIKEQVDEIPRPKDGKNGFELEHFDVEAMGDGRTIKLHFDQGDTRHSYELEFPVAIYQGVYREGHEYAYGDMVTFGGSVWHCDKAGTSEKPGTGGDWRLAIKKGRDGKDAK